MPGCKRRSTTKRCYRTQGNKNLGACALNPETNRCLSTKPPAKRRRSGKKGSGAKKAAPSAKKAKAPNAKKAKTPSAKKAKTPNAKKAKTPNAKKANTPSAKKAKTPRASLYTSECSKIRDLDQVHFKHVNGEAKFEYVAANATYSEKTRKEIGSGFYGNVFLITFDDPQDSQITFKIQKNNPDHADALGVAKSLRKCNLVDFRHHEVNDKLYTIMEHLKGGNTLKWKSSPFLKDPNGLVEHFANFLYMTENCLFDHNATFPDMKPGNVGYTYCNKQFFNHLPDSGEQYFTTDGVEDALTFRLIDLDGINTEISTYPAIKIFKDQCYFPLQKQLQTAYSFAVTTLIVNEKIHRTKSDFSSTFEWETIDTFITKEDQRQDYENRLQILTDAYKDAEKNQQMQQYSLVLYNGIRALKMAYDKYKDWVDLSEQP